MQLANPLHYPLAMLAGGIVLVAGVRLIQLPNLVTVPIAIGTTIAAAAVLKSREPVTFDLENPELERELQSVRSTAIELAKKAEPLRQQAATLLTESFQLELLAAVQIGCDRALSLPAKVSDLAKRLQTSRSILSVDEIQHQLAEVQQKVRSSSGIAKHHLEQLSNSLRRNLQLAQDGQDTRLAQIVNLSTLIQESAGVLQRLQNQLLAVDVNNPARIPELQALSDELLSLQENIELVMQR